LKISLCNLVSICYAKRFIGFFGRKRWQELIKFKKISDKMTKAGAILLGAVFEIKQPVS
jgi:hypothetical protein